MAEEYYAGRRIRVDEHAQICTGYNSEHDHPEAGSDGSKPYPYSIWLDGGEIVVNVPDKACIDDYTALFEWMMSCAASGNYGKEIPLRFKGVVYIENTAEVKREGHLVKFGDYCLISDNEVLAEERADLLTALVYAMRHGSRWVKL